MIFWATYVNCAQWTLHEGLKLSHMKLTVNMVLWDI